MHQLYRFLSSQKQMAIATGVDLWITNVFYGVDQDLNIFFVSATDTKHSQQILDNPHVAFSVSWFKEDNPADRKGIQGIGECVVATDINNITKGIELHNKQFPEFAERITLEYIQTKNNQSAVWLLRPKYIKYWDDELYPDKKTEEFTF